VIFIDAGPRVCAKAHVEQNSPEGSQAPVLTAAKAEAAATRSQGERHQHFSPVLSHKSQLISKKSKVTIQALRAELQVIVLLYFAASLFSVCTICYESIEANFECESTASMLRTIFKKRAF
jgi:hypothetical protein